MASTAQKILLKENIAASVITTGVALEMMHRELCLTLVVAANTGTVDVTVEHSPDLINWFPLKVFTQIGAATGKEYFDVPKILGYVRADVTKAGGACDIDLRLNYSLWK